MSSWTQFFKDAGIPLSAAKRYSVIFEDNRITKDLLPDLSKEILVDMGVKVMGDILCILKQSKKEMAKAEYSGGEGGPLAHSTTPGQQDPVSTTSSKRREARGQGSSDAMPSGMFKLDHDRIAEAVSILPILRSDQLRLDPPALCQPDYEDDAITSYSTVAYAEKNKQQKRQATMYADEETEYSPVKQPRVVVLPGESGQEMYTATALQRAAAIAVASAAILTQEDTPDTRKNRKILEAAGFVPSDVGGSVFSRLDDGEGATHVSPPPSSARQPPPQNKISGDTRSKATIRTSKSRVAVDKSKPRTIKLGKEQRIEAVSTSDLKITSQTRKSSVNDRMGMVSSSKSAEKEKTSGLRSVASSESPALRVRLGVRKKPQHSSVSSSRSELPRQSGSRQKETARPRSMVADELNYQSRQQSDVRSRLMFKEREKAARRKGPLPGRLEKHDVFGRLE